MCRTWWSCTFAIDRQQALRTTISRTTGLPSTAMNTTIVYMPEFDGTGSYDVKGNYRFFQIHFLTSYFLELAQGIPAVCWNALRRRWPVASLAICPNWKDLPILRARYAPMHTGHYALFLHRRTKTSHMFLQSKCVELLTLRGHGF